MKVLLTIVTGWMLLGAAARGDGTPKIEFNDVVYDFGSTDRVQKVRGMFTYWNSGDAELRLTNIRTSCSCTHALAEPVNLLPGESGTLDFSINIGPSVGDIREHVYVASNDPKNPVVALALRLHVKPLYAIESQRIELGGVQAGHATNLVVTVTRTDGQKLRITRVVSDNPAVSARVVPLRESKGRAARIQIQHKAGKTPGRFEETLGVHTGEEYAEGIPKPSFEITVIGHVTEPAR
jgi:hypothetical protein